MNQIKRFIQTAKGNNLRINGGNFEANFRVFDLIEVNEYSFLFDIFLNYIKVMHKTPLWQTMKTLKVKNQL